MRWEGLEFAESNGAFVFLDRSGTPMGGLSPLNGPNFRGNLPDGVWVRRDFVLPIPEGAASVAVGLQVLPIRHLHRSTAAVIHVASWLGPGTEFSLTDPLIDRLDEDLIFP
jgi:hypothetical protein